MKSMMNVPKIGLLALCYLMFSCGGMEFQDVGDFRENRASVKFDDKWGFINNNGEVIIPCKYDRVEEFCEGIAKVCYSDKWGLIDTTGQEFVLCTYKTITDFNENGIAIVENSDGKWGVIDKTGKCIVLCNYDKISDFREDGYCNAFFEIKNHKKCNGNENTCKK